MYRCEHTGKIIPSGVPENKVVVARREMTYENVIKKGKQKGEIKVTRGWEIAKEITVGPDAYKELTGLEPNRGAPKSASIAPKPRGFNAKPPHRKRKWQNPKHKGKRSGPPPAKKGPKVEVINRAKR